MSRIAPLLPIDILRLGLSTLLGMACAVGLGRQACAAEPPVTTGMQAALALEEVLVKAIADTERSVVAIARVRRTHDQPIDLSPSALHRLPFGEQQQPRPGDAEFIPNEYATGVVVGEGGLILTAHHVLRDDSDYWVTTSDRKTYKVTKISAADPRSDLAVLSIEASNLAAIKFGDATKLKKGQIVIALGNPYAIARDGAVSASWGIVSNLARKDGPWPGSPAADAPAVNPTPTLHQLGTLIQTDARLNLGTSGGALINLQGEMVGLTVSLAATLGYEQSAGFALPVDELFLRAVKDLMQGREVEYGLLGIKVRSPTFEDRMRGERGVRVDEVVAHTPAFQAGLKSGDRITHVDDQEINSRDELLLNIGKLPVDDSVRLIVQRDSSAPREILVRELSKYRVYGEKISTTPAPAWRGIRVDYLTASPRFEAWEQKGEIDPQGAVLITAVEPDSPAWKEGLRADMMISHVAGTRVSTPKQFHQQVAGKSGAVKVRLSAPQGERSERVISADAS